MNFNMGDCVKLKSGSPRMTISSKPTNGSIRCQWFVGCEVKDGCFPLESLVHDYPISIEEGIDLPYIGKYEVPMKNYFGL